MSARIYNFPIRSADVARLQYAADVAQLTTLFANPFSTLTAPADDSVESLARYFIEAYDMSPEAAEREAIRARQWSVANEAANPVQATESGDSDSGEDMCSGTGNVLCKTCYAVSEVRCGCDPETVRRCQCDTDMPGEYDSTEL